MFIAVKDFHSDYVQKFLFKLFPLLTTPILVSVYTLHCVIQEFWLAVFVLIYDILQRERGVLFHWEKTLKNHTKNSLLWYRKLPVK